MGGGFAAAWSFGAAAQSLSAGQALGQLVGEITVCIPFFRSLCEEPAGVLMVCTDSCWKGVSDPPWGCRQ